ncbi:Crp/Fnr family transcriptional regulator [Chelatococcus daeguensis]|uniref:Crp/Fnr family transcriptional regulator n=2 Tax=Chelatococcus TaxID=28209 RepID=A0AAC9JT95_9HYPH|nr:MULTISPECIES: Crp/Fnr family transcriptional regulator [Chelatococcus]APF39388.1 Crp/Fnr family transcriptional regulator [Chelatococcus daeguensis]KZE29260.1 Crp/Fnr family transcriptional regulator [Chelatococcus daeguensis]MBM3083984.1 Crp/Fnr family transcriptional regulator [Chelatococcus daeguensis]CUA87153.1 cAMP-binding domain of CRP or a regulatory subunit of cAMP-dependent protein kinases [Chelatococcus sambhunathii]
MTSVDPSVIADVPLFAGLSRAEHEDMLRDAKAIRVAKGRPVFAQGEAAHSFFVLVHGHLRVMKLTPDGQQVVVRFVVPGEIFGVACAIGCKTYPATASAVIDSVVLVWPSAVWPELIARWPALASRAMHAIGGRLQEAHTRVVEMSTRQVEQRVAHALLRLVQQAGRKLDKGVEIAFPITRQDVAEMTGTTLHTVSRILSAWEERGLVEGGRQRIVVREPHQLFILAESSPGASA